MTDDGLPETRLQGKQLVFLFMAATVVAVVVFLSGVMVGRGVRARQTVVGNAVVDPTVPVVDATTSEATPRGGAKEPFAYPGYLDGKAPPPEVIREPVAPPTGPAIEVVGDAGSNVREAAPTPERSVGKGASAGSQAGGGAAPSAPSLAEPAGKGFVVQVSASRDRSEAERLARRLVAKGYPAFVSTSAGGTARMYRVRVGKYGDRREAESVSRRLTTEEQFKPWITR
jgi:cell division septation protein DedD